MSAKYERMCVLAKRVRLSLNITQQQLAERAGITREEVDLYERNLPVYLDARRKIIKELWAMKTSKKTNIYRTPLAVN
jgi:transcriptional regulator with XRE-family HTH domain